MPWMSRRYHGTIGHNCLNIRFEERAGIELLVAQPLVELLLLCLNLLARGVVGADQQIADDDALFKCMQLKG